MRLQKLGVRMGAMPPQPSRIVGVVSCAFLTLAACGGGSLSKDGFIEQADNICSEALEAAQEVPQPTDPASAESYANDLEEITRGYISELRDLEPPEEDAETIEDLIDDIEQAGLKIVEATRSNTTGGDSAQAYAEALELAETANESAAAYGFESCGISEGLAPH
jgi:hypothetical protein